MGDLFASLFRHYTPGPWGSPGVWTEGYPILWNFVSSLLDWDILKGGMIFLMAVGIVGYAVVRIRRGFGV
jgi:hypothetical protein